MKSNKVDLLNIGLIIISLALAFVLPFQLFLVSYAVLGPLHYLTEINWLREKNYFTHEPSWVWLAVLLALLIVVPKLLLLPEVNHLIENSFLASINNWLLTYSNGFLFLGLAVAIGLVISKSRAILIPILLAGIILAFFLNEFPFYITVIGLLIPTLIHVYIFTILFMLKGSLESGSKVGYIAIGMMIAAPLVIALVDINRDWYSISDSFKAIFTESQFHVTNAKLAKTLGLGDGTSFYFYEKMELKLQTFIAFAYLYHYLNWFSKTTVIKWHKSISLTRALIIGGIWLVLISIFAYNYRVGLLVALTLSFLHVLLEFPLNIISIKSIPLAFQKAINGKA